MKDESPDIVALNETKLDKDSANHYLCFDGYVSMFKAREENPLHGGGVAILVKVGLNHARDWSFDKFEREVVAVNISLQEGPFLFITIYNPPRTPLPAELFSLVESRGDRWMIMGDLNSKLVGLGCRSDDDNGLSEILLSGSGLILNNRVPTYLRFNSADYWEVLDLCICSPSTASKLLEFSVLLGQNMGSDHFPICAKINLSRKNNKSPGNKKTFNVSKANWSLFKDELPTNTSNEEYDDIEKLSSFISKGILSAAYKSIPCFKTSIQGKKLPSHILELIKKKRTAFKNLLNSKKRTIFGNFIDHKSVFYEAQNEVKKAIKVFRNVEWNDFLKKS